jgi:acyl carrier protein
MNFLDLLNKVAREARPAHHQLSPIDAMDVKFTDTEIDSLDGMMIVMYFAIIYDIPDDVSKDFHPETPQQLLDFVEQNKARTPASIEEAIGMIK